jgi:hypothetical protein
MLESSPLLSVPNDRRRRWELLGSLIDRWYSPLEPLDGHDAGELLDCEERLRAEFPRALTEWYLQSGRRLDVWNRRNAFLFPHQVSFVDDVLQIYVEEDLQTSWGIRRAQLDMDDPPVVVRADRGQWLEQNPQVSEFALHVFAFSLQFNVESHQARGQVTPSCIERIKAEIPQLALPEFLWTQSILFGFRDLVVAFSQGDSMAATACDGAAMEWFRLRTAGEDLEFSGPDPDLV